MASFTSYELILACSQPGCAACRLEQRDLERYLSNQLYENVNSIPLRDRLRASRGYCREHAWLAVDKHLGDALGFAIIYHDVLGAVLRQLDAVLTAPTQGLAALQRRISEKVMGLVGSVTRVISPQKECPACRDRDYIRSLIITALVKELSDPKVVEALNTSDGLCFMHLRLALEAVGDPAGFEKLLEIHRAKLESLRAELAELIRKNDHRYIEEGFGPEGDSWRRAIAMVAGNSDRE